MTEKQELIYRRLGATVDKLDDCAHWLLIAQTEYCSEAHIGNAMQILLRESKKIAECVNECRKHYLSISPTPSKSKKSFDAEIAKSIDVSFELVDFGKFKAYKLTFPFILERKYTDKTLWTNSYLAVLSENNKIERIKEPAIVFELNFDKFGNQNNLKDVDNYDKSLIINMLQMYFIEDDRNATVVSRNNVDSTENKTIVYVFDKKYLSIFFEKK